MRVSPYLVLLAVLTRRYTPARFTLPALVEWGSWSRSHSGPPVTGTTIGAVRPATVSPPAIWHNLSRSGRPLGAARVCSYVCVGRSFRLFWTIRKSTSCVFSMGPVTSEQARGKTLDKRADIWAFGVVLYEMLAGWRLFEGETISDTLAANSGLWIY